MLREIVSLKAGGSTHYECGLDGCTKVSRAYNLAHFHATWVHLVFVEREKVKVGKGKAGMEVRYRLRRPSLDELMRARARMNRNDSDLKLNSLLREAERLLDLMYQGEEPSRTSLELGWAPALYNQEKCKEEAKEREEGKDPEKRREQATKRTKAVASKSGRSSTSVSLVASETEGEPVAKKVRGRPRGPTSKPVSSDETDSEREDNIKFASSKVSSTRVSRTVSTRSSRAVSEERIETVTKKVSKHKKSKRNKHRKGKRHHKRVVSSSSSSSK